MPFGGDHRMLFHGLGLFGLLCYAPPTIVAIAHLLGILQ
jgi:hypothetical protein